MVGFLRLDPPYLLDQIIRTRRVLLRDQFVVGVEYALSD